MLRAGDSRSRPGGAGAYAWYVLGVLFLVYVFNFIDRQILSILAQDIKTGLGLGDAQIGFLYGTSFAVFYALFGIPLGRLADGWYRGRLIAMGLAVWSGMTALSGLAQSYGQLAAARVGVGIGEASATPAAYSLLADYFPRERRALAVAVYASGLYVGAGLSLPLGGWVAHAWSAHFAAASAPFGLAGWQAAFLAVGLPGLVLALWVLSLREPPRGLADGRPAPARRPGAWREFLVEVAAILPPFTLWSVARFAGALRLNLLLLAAIGAAAALLVKATGDLLQWCAYGVGAYAVCSWVQMLRATDRPAYALLWGTPAVMCALVGVGFIAFVTYSLSFWLAPYAIRTFGVPAHEAGLLIGVPGGFASAAGCILGGRLSDAWRRRDPRGRILVCSLSVLLPPPFIVAALSAGDVQSFYWLAPLVVLVANLWVGSAAVAVQESVLLRMRATAGAKFLLATSLVGLALGPYFVGRVSALAGSLRTGMLSAFVVSPIALLLLWYAARGLPAAESSKEARAAAFGERQTDPPRALRGAGESDRSD